jgi:hypothetical protein
VAKTIHQELGKNNMGFVQMLLRITSAVLDNQAFTLYWNWNGTIYTARTVSNNTPDITLIDKAAKKVTLTHRYCHSQHKQSGINT